MHSQSVLKMSYQKRKRVEIYNANKVFRSYEIQEGVRIWQKKNLIPMKISMMN